MATQYDPNTNTTITTPERGKGMRYAWIAVGAVVLFIIAVFAFPTRERSGMDLTTGTPPVVDERMPGASEPAPPATP